MRSQRTVKAEGMPRRGDAHLYVRLTLVPRSGRQQRVALRNVMAVAWGLQGSDGSVLQLDPQGHLAGTARVYHRDRNLGNNRLSNLVVLEEADAFRQGLALHPCMLRRRWGGAAGAAAQEGGSSTEDEDEDEEEKEGEAETETDTEDEEEQGGGAGAGRAAVGAADGPPTVVLPAGPGAAVVAAVAAGAAAGVAVATGAGSGGSGGAGAAAGVGGVGGGRRMTPTEALRQQRAVQQEAEEQASMSWPSGYDSGGNPVQW